MTIRILEDGDYRLQESGCIRDLQQSARVLENLSLRTYQNGATKQTEDAKAIALQLQNCCGARKLEGGGQRLVENIKGVPLSRIVVGVPNAAWIAPQNLLTFSVLTAGTGPAKSAGLLDVVVLIFAQKASGKYVLVQNPSGQTWVSGSGGEVTEGQLLLNQLAPGNYQIVVQAYDGSFQNPAVQSSLQVNFTVVGPATSTPFFIVMQTCPGTSC